MKIIIKNSTLVDVEEPVNFTRSMLGSCIVSAKTWFICSSEKPLSWSSDNAAATIGENVARCSGERD